MAHALDMTGGRANMAYVGEAPWHGLGKKLTPNSPLEVWMKEAGMDWTAKKAMTYFSENGIQYPAESKIIYRSDTKAELGTCSDRYKLVQPGEVLEFFRDLVGVKGWAIETAGCLDGGKRLWALAKTDGEIAVNGTIDRIGTYLLLATSFDGSLTTIGKFTSVRVVCQNTLSMSIGDKLATIKVPHSTTFDAKSMKEQLGIYETATTEMQESVDEMAKYTLKDSEAMKFIKDVLAGKDVAVEDMKSRGANIVKGVFDLYRGKGIGATMASSDGTLWGALNAVTEYVDHHVNARTANNRLAGAWFGKGEFQKNNAYREAISMISKAA